MRRLVLFAAFVSLGALPGSVLATEEPRWQEPVAGISTDVDFASVAQLNGSKPGGTVVAVGYDDKATPAKPVIYRMVGGVWGTDTLELPAGGTRLVDVVIGQNVAWAVGWHAPPPPPETRQPLVLKFVPDSPAPDPETGEPVAPPPVGQALGQAGGSWKPVDTTGAAAAGAITSVALSGDDAVFGTSSGEIYSLAADEQLTRIDLEPGGSALEPAGAEDPDTSETSQLMAPIVGVALNAPGSGFAVSGASPGSPSPGQIFKIASSATDAWTEPEAQDPVSISGARETPKVTVAASGAHAVAIDGKQVWERNFTGAWARKRLLGTLDGDALKDVAMVQSGDETVSVVLGYGTLPVFWTRKGSSDWSVRKQVTTTTKTLRGIAIESTDSMWAVGDDGTILRYPAPPPPPPPADDGGGGDGGDGGDSGSGSDGGSSTTDDTASDTSTADNSTTDQSSTAPQPSTRPASKAPEVIVDQPKPPPPPRRPGTRPRPKPRQLVSRVSVTRLGRSLVIKFRLAAPARIAVSARVGRRLVGTRRFRRLARGRHRVVLPYSGRRLPTKLKIVARARTKNRNANGGRR